MPTLCPACKTENASDATICSHCAAALPLPQPPPAPQRTSLLEQAMAKTAALPLAQPVAPPVVAAPAAPAVPEAAPVPPPAPAPAIAKQPYTMPPLPPQPRPRRRSRAPWILAAVLLLGLVGALVYEQLQIRGVSLSSLFTTRP